MKTLMAFLKDDGFPSPWTNVYGLARCLLAFGTLLTLLVHDVDTLFRPTGQLLSEVTGAISVSRMSLFFLVPNLELARWIAVACLVLVLSGWRPRITGVLHWWVAFSFSLSCVILDGGDQVTAVMTALLLPVTLTDPRRWHWSALPDSEMRLGRKVAALVAWSAFLVIRLQVAAIYFHAAAGKTSVTEWINGTALYYWFTHPVFGLAEWLQPAFLPVLTSGLGVTLLTWGAVLLEVFLCMALVLDKRWWQPLLWVALGFHFSILIIHGLVTFFFAMAGALVLYLRPKERPFAWPVRLRLASRAVRPAEATGPIAAASGPS